MNELISIEKVAQWQKLKTLVLNSVSSPITKRVYNMALEEFMAWFQQAPRPGFSKATVSAWRVSLEERRLGSSSIIIRMSAIRKLAAEAADNGMLAPELAAGISRVKSAKTQGIRVGNVLLVLADHECRRARILSAGLVSGRSPIPSGSGLSKRTWQETLPIHGILRRRHAWRTPRSRPRSER